MRSVILVVSVLAGFAGLSIQWAACVALAGCSKKKSDSPAAKPETGGDHGSQNGSGSAPAPTPVPAAKPAPAIGFADLTAAEPRWSIEAMERGLWISENGAPLEQRCRVELGMAMGSMGKYRAAAEKAGAAATTCEATGAYTTCTFTNPDKAASEQQATWIFGNDDDSDGVVLLAVLLGPPGDRAAIEPQLGQKRACPRPSDDPQ
jgi:hypothetical protein